MRALFSFSDVFDIPWTRCRESLGAGVISHIILPCTERDDIYAKIEYDVLENDNTMLGPQEPLFYIDEEPNGLPCV